MKFACLYFLLLGLMPFMGMGQQKVQTLVPHQVIAVGEAFQVQFISMEEALMIQSPDFGKNFQLVSGPRIYHGITTTNNIRSVIQNFSYTLVPLRTGRLVVKGV